MMLTAFVLLCGILSLSVIAENIIRHQCGTEATFYKIASNHALNNGDNTVTLTTSEGVSGCIEFCVKNESCKAFNYKTISPVESICEPLSNDRNTKDVVARERWSYYDKGSFSSQIGQHCRKLSYNPCYPCLCMDSCHSSSGYSCNCTKESPCQPDIFIAFETTLTGNPTKTVYNRGKDRSDNNVLTMINGATIDTVLDRPGKVLKIVGTSAGAIVGNFQDSCINNPEAGLCSLSLWLRIVSPNPGYQTVIGTGRLKLSTGLLVRVSNNAKTIIARFVAPKKHLSIKTSLPDTLQSWTHLTLTSNWEFFEWNSIFHEALRHRGPRAKLDSFEIKGNRQILEWLSYSINISHSTGYIVFGSVYTRTLFSHSAVKLVLYINGKIVAEDTTYETTSASPTAHPDLIIGAGTLYPLVNDHWAIQLDDLAIWDGYLLKHEEVVYVMNQDFEVEGKQPSENYWLPEEE